MRKLNEIIVHCTATREGQNFTVNQIRKWHKAKNWNDIGYHYLIYIDGSVHAGRPLGKIGAHVAGHNTGTIGISYVGGVRTDGKTPKDTRTPAQAKAIVELIQDLMSKYPTISKISGHNQYANKACPSFDADAEYNWITGGEKKAPKTTPKAGADGRIKYLQKLLTERGFSVGEVDGLIGKNTIAAIKDFQKDRSLTVNGLFDEPTVALLRLVEAPEKPVETVTKVIEPTLPEEPKQGLFVTILKAIFSAIKDK